MDCLHLALQILTNLERISKVEDLVDESKVIYGGKYNADSLYILLVSNLDLLLKYCD